MPTRRAFINITPQVLTEEIGEVSLASFEKIREKYARVERRRASLGFGVLHDSLAPDPGEVIPLADNPPFGSGVMASAGFMLCYNLSKT